MDISPDKENLNSVFSNSQYQIDFYQRDYRWTKEPVLRLLDDIFFKFNETYKDNDSLPPDETVVDEKYPWYYLNTYVTNKVRGHVFVVDGQQRLTTLSLILIKLLHMAQGYKSQTAKWLDNKIAGQVGFKSEFWMNHEAHKATQKALYDNDLENVDTSTGVTAENMHQNFLEISDFLDENIPTRHKLETFVFYFLRRVVLIKLAVEQTDVPMVFEVINDRGVRLKPFEILKGKLLGQIDKILLDKKGYNELWEDRVQAINNYSEDGADSFFRYWLKAKFTDTRKEGQRFDGDYHRIMFSKDFDEHLKIRHSQKGVLDFLDGPFTYYTALYEKFLESYVSDTDTAYTYIRLNDLDGAFLLILSACKDNDPEEDQKLALIPAEIDRLFSLLQLQGAYDSNNFQEMLYKISSEIRDAAADTIRPVFDKCLVEELSKQRLTEVDTPFKYTFFKQTGVNLNSRFKRYFFARIEQFLAENMSLNMKHSIDDLVRKTGSKSGFHIEHILAHNDENMALFEGDEDRFESERNRLGGVLLLKGKDNISSNNESYRQKLKSYANTLYWNETLRADSYKSKLDMTDLKKKYRLDLGPMDSFGPEELEARQNILFKIASILWR